MRGLEADEVRSTGTELCLRLGARDEDDTIF